MDSLDSIWDEPVVETVQKRASEPPDDRDDSPRPAKRQRQQPLFLADSDDDMDASRTRAPVQPLNAELDALFADLDDDTFAPLPGRLDEAEIARKAEERVRRDMPSLTPYQVIPSSSPPRDTGSPSGNKNSRGGKGDTEKKERRRIVKLDEARLLNPTYGFPQLIKMTKDFKIKGKGHEATDLSRLLQKYQYWTHQLYPKLQFQDTVERVEKLCHSRRMNVALSVWRDEFHGRPTGRDAMGIDEDEDEEDTGAIDDEDQAERNHRMETGDPQARPPRSSPSVPSSRASSPPATSGAESNMDGPSASRGPGPSFSEPEPDEDEEFWKSLDDFGDSSMDAHAPAPPPPPKTAPAPAPSNGFDEDEDMWDLIDEVEREASMQRPAASSGQPPPPPAALPKPPSAQREFADPSEWDDMYADE